MKVLIWVNFLIYIVLPKCIHDQAIKNHKITTYTDHTNTGRLLQQSQILPIRIYIDQTPLPFQQFRAQRQMIDLILKISENFYKNMLTVRRIPGILFPQDDRVCNKVTIPPNLKDNGTNPQIQADFGIIRGFVIDRLNKYIASAITCTQYNGAQSNKMRPIWGSINFNLATFPAYFKEGVTQQEFQTITYIGIHQIAHAMAFSSDLYGKYQNPLFVFNNKTDPFSLIQERFQRIVKQYYNCTEQQVSGGILQDDGSQGSALSHWEKQLFGNQLMIAQTSTEPYISNLTVALFQVTGWYPNVSKQFVEPSIWGKNKGCGFLKKQSCEFQQFCPNRKQIDCDFSNIGSGQCQSHKFIKQCLGIRIKQNSICTNENYLKGVRGTITTGQTVGKYSKCFKGDLRKKGQVSNRQTTRCYQARCLKNNRFMVLKIAQRNFVCFYPGYIIQNVPQFDGIVQCPKNFDRICKSKQSCPYGCGRSGTCINGQCLCIGSNRLTPTCPLSGSQNRLLLEQDRKKIIQKSLECFSGYIFDPITKRCQSCIEILSCSKCDKFGCLQCDDGSIPINGKC